MKARSELERRKKYIDVFEAQIGTHHSFLVSLVEQCLDNIPDQRPTTDELLTGLQKMAVEIEGEYGDNPVKLDLVRVRLAKTLKAKDQKIEEMLQIQVKIIMPGGKDLILILV